MYFYFEENRKDDHIMLLDLALLSTLIGSNYPCLVQIFIVPKVFEPSKFDLFLSRDSPVKLAIFSLNLKQIATKGFFAFLLRTSIPI